MSTPADSVPEQLRQGRILIWRFQSVLTFDDGEEGASSSQTGPRRQSIFGSEGGSEGGTEGGTEEPLLVVDFDRHRQPMLQVRGEPVGERRKNLVRLWDREYRIRHRLFGKRYSFQALLDDRAVLTVRQESEYSSTVQRLAVSCAADLDATVVLALVILHVRPHHMPLFEEVIGEMFG